MKEQICIRQMIEEESIQILFQPIVSTYQGKVAGVEALVRGTDVNNDKWISPFVLFNAAREAGMVIALDRLCQRKAIEQFGELFEEHHDLILFLNVDNSVIHLDNNTEAIYEYCLEHNVLPKNVVLEINELHSADIDAVVRFTNKYREKGFMISIDDIGAGYSNLDRIILLQPDIIKIDKELIRDVHKHYYKQQVVEMIIHLGERTGALIVAEGVEAIEEILAVHQYGTHLLQGFYISEPIDMNDKAFKGINNMVRHIAERQRLYLAEFMVDTCKYNTDLKVLFEHVRLRIEEECVEDEEGCLNHILSDYPDIECAYVIDNNGKQITDTIFNDRSMEVHRKTLFSPYRRGDDATLKAYYYILKTTHQEMYVSSEYLSLATGNRCITISGYFSFAGRKQILCLDIVKYDQYTGSKVIQNYTKKDQS